MPSSKSSKKDKKESKKDKDKEKERRKEKELKLHKKNKSNKSDDDHDEKDKKRPRDDIEPGTPSKKPKETQDAPKTPQVHLPQMKSTQAPVKFSIPPMLNTQREPPKPQKHPNHWRRMLSDEILSKLELEKVADERSTDGHLEGGWRLIYKNDDRKTVVYRTNTPILTVASFTGHGVGLKPPKKNDSGRIFKSKLEASCSDELDALDPQIRKDHEEFTAGMDKLTARVAQLMFAVSKVQMTENALRKSLEADIKNEPERYGIEAWEKVAKKDKDGFIEKYLDEWKKRPDALQEAFEQFQDRMTTYRFMGDQKYPADKIPTFRLQTKVFFQKKKDERMDASEHGDQSSASRKVPQKYSGGKHEGKRSNKDVEELEDDAPEKSEESDDDSADIDEDDYGDMRYDDMSNEKVTAIIDAMRKKGYVYRRLRYKNHDGTPLALGEYAKDRNYRVVDSNDMIQQEFSLWIYSLMGDGRYGYRMQETDNVWFIRQGVRRASIPISEGSIIGQNIVLRPKELSISAAPNTTATPQIEEKQKRREQELAGSDQDRSDSEADE